MSEESGELHLRVFRDRSELHLPDGDVSTFREGPASGSQKVRQAKIEDAFRDGFLQNEIILCRSNVEKLSFDDLSEEHISVVSGLADSVTSEVGRALVGLSILQMAIKVIEPEQSIRLHKSGTPFGWSEGISMRSLDKKFVTPVLREFDLVRMNADGFMMTRSLAENYPYSSLYKAALRGARQQWLDLVEFLEIGSVSPRSLLRLLLSKLINRAEDFEVEATRALVACDAVIDEGRLRSVNSLISFFEGLLARSTYPARVMEIAMHSLLQSQAGLGLLGELELKALSQMRNANKKNGNIGDVELVRDSEIVLTWDAKFGKGYLRDELEELEEKLRSHDLVEEAGFVTSVALIQEDELFARCLEIEELTGVRISIQTFSEWAGSRLASLSPEEEIQVCREWLISYAESLAQRRPKIAPIDEPCHAWVIELRAEIEIILRGGKDDVSL